LTNQQLSRRLVVIEHRL